MGAKPDDIRGTTTKDREIERTRIYQKKTRQATLPLPYPTYTLSAKLDEPFYKLNGPFYRSHVRVLEIDFGRLSGLFAL
jgi:hypothetical protein